MIPVLEEDEDRVDHLACLGLTTGIVQCMC